MLNLNFLHARRLWHNVEPDVPILMQSQKHSFHLAQLQNVLIIELTFLLVVNFHQDR